MMEESGGLSVGERLERIENAVLRIEDKLDTKVSIDVYESAVKRIELLESGETPLGKYFLNQYAQLAQQVSDLTLHGSQQAQEATKKLVAMEIDIAKYRTDMASQKAIAGAAQIHDTRTLRVWGVIISAIAAISMAGSAISVIVQLAH